MPRQPIHLVTGARGQLGSHIAEQLRAAGALVRALVRPGKDPAFLRGLGVELIEGDLSDAAVVRRAVAGAAVVYHCAARVSDWGPWSAFEREAVTPTRNLVEACRAEDVGRLLHVSSISVYGHPYVAASGPITEDTPLGQRFWLWDYYPRAKLLAEQIAWDYAAVTVVRPSWIYGPRDRVTVPRLVPALLERRVPIIGRGDNLLNLIYAGDVAAGAILAAQDPKAVGRVYNLCSEGEVTQRELLDALTDALALPRIRKRVPYFLAMRFAFLKEAVARLLRRPSPPTITRRAIYLVGRSTQFSTARAREELGWRPRVAVQEGVRRTLEWYSGLEENRHIRVQAPVLTGSSGPRD
jgi:nucleoside-diphosphate-sugar epimerase